MILKILSKKTGLSEEKIELFINSASHRYKKYYIKRKKPNTRKRLIHHPSKELKFLQYIIKDKVLSKFKTHKAVFSYRKNKSILHNALNHVGNNYLLRIDFENFFPSITSQSIEKFFIKNNDDDLSNHDINLITKILCKNKKLTIGAPTSPILSNIILYDFDHKMECLAKDNNVSYSRYADDIFLSTNERDVLASLLEEAKKIIKDFDLKLNDKKTIFTSRKRKKVVTGLVLTSDKKVSIGRKKKRKIKSMVFKFLNRKLTMQERNILAGQLSYIISVEPIFILNLKKKYGADIIKNINMNRC